MTFSSALAALAAIGAVQTFTTGSVVLVGRRSGTLRRLLPLLVSGAAGVLLATACLDLLPEAIRMSGSGPAVWTTLLVSLLVLFCLEALVDAVSQPERVSGLPVKETELASQPHAHHLAPHLERSPGSLGTTPLLLGSALHSAVDGIAIAAAFQAGAGPGWSATLAIALHETPHRLSDFSLLLHKGIPVRRALWWSVLAGATALVGGLLVVVLGLQPNAAHLLLPVSAASFLYIALVDLVPELQAHRDPTRMWWEVLALLAGAGLIAAALHIAGE